MKVKPYTMEAVARICLDAELTAWQAVTAVAVAWAESGGNAYAVGINDARPDNVAYLSVDLGMWQTNSYWHPDIAPPEAFDPVRQIEHVKRISRKVGRWGFVSYDWSLWNAYKAGMHTKFLSAAVVAVRAAGGAL